MEPSTSIIKSDRIGRNNYSREYREEVLAAFDDSGMSGSAFARQCGIKYPTFASWVTKRRKAKSDPVSSSLTNSFILAELQEPSLSGSGLQIQLSAQSTVTMTSAEQAPLLAALIKALA